MVPPNRYVVADDQAGTRLDLFLARQDPDHSRSVYQRAIADGRVRLNGRRARKWERVSPGDAVDVEPFAPPAAGPVPDASVPFVVVHEDPAVLVVDKPAGVPVHPHRAEETGTLASGLVARFPDLVGVGPQPLEPGLVHRLDTQTSGLIVVARTPAAFRSLASQFAARTVEKVYVALVLGNPPARTTITTPIGHHPTDPRRMIVEGDPAGPPRSVRQAATHVAIRRRFAGYAEVEVRITTGRMHQIRAHLASIGHPLAGDALYQSPAEFAKDRLGLPRPFLHAARLAFDHPTDGRRIEVSAPLPPDLVAVLARLEEAGTDDVAAESAPAAPRPAKRRTTRKPAARPQGPRFIRRPGGGKASPPAEEGAATPSPARAEEAATHSSWLDLDVPPDEEIRVRLDDEPKRQATRTAPPSRRARGAERPAREGRGAARPRDRRDARAEAPRRGGDEPPRPGETFGVDPERPRRGDRQARDARRAGAFAPTGRRPARRPDAREPSREGRSRPAREASGHVVSRDRRQERAAGPGRWVRPPRPERGFTPRGAEGGREPSKARPRRRDERPGDREARPRRGGDRPFRRDDRAPRGDERSRARGAAARAAEASGPRRRRPDAAPRAERRPDDRPPPPRGGGPKGGPPRRGGPKPGGPRRRPPRSP